VNFGTFSSELCGGTHVDRTGQIGAVVPVSEKSVGAGLRRLEFLAGELAQRHVRAQLDALEAAAAALRVGPDEVPQRVTTLLEERRELQRQLDELKRKGVMSAVS